MILFFREILKCAFLSEDIQKTYQSTWAKSTGESVWDQDRIFLLPQSTFPSTEKIYRHLLQDSIHTRYLEKSSSERWKVEW